MTILFVDSCDHYSAASEITRKWDAVTSGLSIVSNGGRFGGRCISSGSLAGGMTQKSLPVAKTTVVVGMAVSWNAATPGNSTNTVFIEFRNGSTVICGLAYDFHTQVYKAFRTSIATAVLGSVFKPHGGVAHHLVFKVLRNATTGTVDLWIDGVSILSLTNQNTGASDIDNVRIGLASTSSGITMNWEDVFITDSENLGDRRVYMLVPNGDDSVQFTRSGGATNAAAVDELPTNNDTDYVESSTVGHLDRYTLTDLGVTPVTIDCVALNTINRKDDAGARTIKGHIFSNATKADGATIGPTTSYLNTQDLFPLDPNGNIAWAGAAVDALRAGFEIVS